MVVWLNVLCLFEGVGHDLVFIICVDNVVRSAAVPYKILHFRFSVFVGYTTLFYLNDKVLFRALSILPLKNKV